MNVITFIIAMAIFLFGLWLMSIAVELPGFEAISFFGGILSVSPRRGDPGEHPRPRRRRPIRVTLPQHDTLVTYPAGALRSARGCCTSVPATDGRRSGDHRIDELPPGRRGMARPAGRYRSDPRRRPGARHP